MSLESNDDSTRLPHQNKSNDEQPSDAESDLDELWAKANHLKTGKLESAADLRAPTPSAAAELASISISELAQNIITQQNQLYRIMENRLNKRWQELDHLIDRQSLQHPRMMIIRNREKLDIIMHQIDFSMHQFLSMKRTKLKGFEKELSVLNPSDILHRGYSIAFSDDGSIIRHADDLNAGDSFILKTGSGRFSAEKKKMLPDSE